MIFKKMLCVILTILLTISVLVGCSKESKKNDGMVVEPGTGDQITLNPLELTLHMRVGPEAFDFEKQTMFQEVFKITNMKMRGTSSQAATSGQQEFNLMLTNQPLPDIIHGTKAQLNNAGVDGALIPLDDLIEKYAPNISAFLKEVPEAKKASVASDGKLYYIPFYREGLPAAGFYVRKDWLDKLNLEVPKNVDEYYNVLKAFRERDPNGNGIKDEVPFFQREKSINGLLQLWNAQFNWYIDENGQYIHGKLQPEYKTAMINLAKWYAEGLIDKEIYSRGSEARQQLLGDNVGGATHDWFSSTGSFNETLKDKINNFEFLAIPPPADVNGVVKETRGRSSLTGHGWGISVDNKYVVESIKYMDFWFTPQGIRIANFGVEGVDYTLVDGKPVFTDKVLKASGGAPTYLRSIGQAQQGGRMYLESELQGMTSYAREGFNLYLENDYVLEQLPQFSFTREEERVIKERELAITTYIDEVAQKWLFGIESVEEGFDKYIQQFESMGYKEVQAAYQSAYERYKKTK